MSDLPPKALAILRANPEAANPIAQILKTPRGQLDQGESAALAFASALAGAWAKEPDIWTDDAFDGLRHVCRWLEAIVQDESLPVPVDRQAEMLVLANVLVSQAAGVLKRMGFDQITAAAMVAEYFEEAFECAP